MLNSPQQNLIFPEKIQFKKSKHLITCDVCHIYTGFTVLLYRRNCSDFVYVGINAEGGSLTF